MSHRLLIFDSLPPPPSFQCFFGSPGLFIILNIYTFFLEKEQFFTCFRFWFFSCNCKVYITLIIEPFLSTLRECSYFRMEYCWTFTRWLHPTCKRCNSFEKQIVINTDEFFILLVWKVLPFLSPILLLPLIIHIINLLSKLVPRKVCGAKYNFNLSSSS